MLRFCNGMKVYRISIFVAAFVLTGCSTLHVTKQYRLIGGEKLPRVVQVVHDERTKTPNIRVWHEINQDLTYSRFGSMGFFGLPLIPVGANPLPPRELNVAVTLTFEDLERDFKFSSRPCLVVDRSNPICAHEAIVSAVGMHRRDVVAGSAPAQHHRRQGIAAFESKTSDIVPAGVPIDRNRVYQHYGYTGSPAWDFFRVSILYKFKCGMACPKEFNLPFSQFGEVEGWSHPTKSFAYKLVREVEYKPSVLLQ